MPSCGKTAAATPSKNAAAEKERRRRCANSLRRAYCRGMRWNNTMRDTATAAVEEIEELHEKINAQCDTSGFKTDPQHIALKSELARQTAEIVAKTIAALARIVEAVPNP